ncbi:MAG: hypothetical protein HUJ56_00095, partial [Erysipelotrichaceae bacterium]|nr:hypothetical protein [Erysipelotrichaceae bacterium]
MPRASGGGSHSSGSHSSSSSYSRSSSSSSSSSYSSSSGYYQPERKVSRHYFNGAERYRYYNWRHEPVYVYMNAAPEKPSLFKLILSIIVSGAMIF